MVPTIKLLDINDEEDRDIQTIEQFMKKFNKLWKNLFYKYANCGYSSK